MNGGLIMQMEKAIRAIAGTFILLSISLGCFVSPYWFFFTGFVGLNLLQSAFTGWCPMETFLGKLGVVRVQR
jgi:hypothetical protein